MFLAMGFEKSYTKFGAVLTTFNLSMRFTGNEQDSGLHLF
jgi:hypothetical protein